MSNISKEKLIESTAEYSGVAVGAALGAGIGTAVAGPVGAVGGSVVGSVVEKVFVWAGNEIKNRSLSVSENRKIETVYDVAKEKISSKLSTGIPLRADGFFCMELDERSSAEEILEGTLFAAQRESEEKKLPYLANLYANINFDEMISRPMANQLIKIASMISYRQIAILSVVGNCQLGICKEPLRDTAFRGFEKIDDMSIAAEIYELYRMSLLISKSAILDSSSFVPSLLVMNGMGKLLYDHMELVTMPSDDTVQSILSFLTNDSPVPTSDDIVTGELPTATWEEIDALFEKKTADIPKLSVATIVNDDGDSTLVINDY